VQPDRVRIVEIGFRSAGLPGRRKAFAAGTLGGDWASAHRGEGIARREDEAVMVTGDGNLVELQATVRYTISRPDLYTFMFEVRDPDETIRAAAESVLREEVAARPFLELLTVNRERFQEEVLGRLRKRWETSEYGPHGLGVQLDGLSVHDLHPPQDPARVVDAFHDVAKAMERRDQRVNQAEAERVRMISTARAEEMKMVREAEAAADEKVRQAEVLRDTFLAHYRLRHELSPQEEWQLLSDAAATVTVGQDPMTAYQEYQQRRQVRLALQAYLTDFRLALRSLAGALQKRDKVIVDADKVPGKRHLLMFDPELLRPPPVILPRDSMPPRSPLRREEGP
jgi:regulator of protease activity HflC (stomatin/prohibitin superfamily)